MTHRIELFLEVCLKELNSFWKYAPKNGTFFLIRLKELNFFQIWLKDLNLSFWHDSKFWTFFFGEHDSKNWTFFVNMTRFFRKNLTQRIETFSMTLELNFLSKNDSKYWFFKNMTHRIATFFFEIMTQRIKIFGVWLKELNLLKIWLTELNFFFSWLKELNSFLLCITQRIELFFWMTQRIEPFVIYQKYLKELNLLLHDSKNWTFFFFENDSQNWTFFFEYDSQNWTLFSLNMTKELDSFLNMTQGIEPFNFRIWLKRIKLFLHRTQRIEIIFEWLKRIELLDMTQRMELLWKKKTWLREMNFFFDITQRIGPLGGTKLWFKELNFI